MKFLILLSAAAGLSSAAGVCSKGKYVYNKCQFNVQCSAKGAGYDNFTYQNVTTFTSCMQQCLTGQYACDAVNYSSKKNTCVLVLSPTGNSTAKGLDYAVKTSSEACGNVG